MPSAKQCFDKAIEDAFKGRKFGEKKKRALNKSYENWKENFARTDPANADTLAAKKVIDDYDLIAKEAKRRQKAQVMKMMQFYDEVWAVKDKDMGKLARAPQAYIVSDDLIPTTNYISVKDGVRGRAHQILNELIDKYGRKGLGWQRRLDEKKVLDELFKPGSSGDADAAAFAKAWNETAEYLVRRFRTAGGSLSELTDWRLPQVLSKFKLYKVTVEEFVDDMMGRLDWQKMHYPDGRPIGTGNVDHVFPDGKTRNIPEKEAYLRGAYHTLKSDGAWKKVRAKHAAGGKGVGNLLEKHRELHYKDAESWLAVHQKYGEGQVFDVMMRHVDLMAGRIAMVQKFGANHEGMAEYMKRVVNNRLSKYDEVNKTALKGKAEKALNTFDDMMKILTQENVMEEMNGFGSFMAGLRHILSSSMLGGAALLAMPTDTVTMMVTSKYNRTPMGKSLTRYMRMMNPLDASDRQLAVQSGLINDNATAMAAAAARYTGLETHGPHIARKFSDFVMRASLMSGHTQAMRWAWQMELMGAFARDVGTDFADLPYVDMLRRYGINENDWATLISMTPKDHKGAKFLVPNELYKTNMDPADIDPVVDKFMQMILEEGRYAVPDSSLSGRAFMTGATRPGTWPGELTRSTAMFKQFPVTMVYTHGRRGLEEAVGRGKMWYLPALVTGMTVAGGLSLQMREIAKGKEPRPMGMENGSLKEATKFWASAFLTGGGAMIFGDFLFSDLNRYGGGLTETVAGPPAGIVEDALNLTLGNAWQLAMQEDTNALPEAVRLAKQVTPGSTLWWSRLILERYGWNYLEELVDPKVHRKRNRRRSKIRKDYGQEYWWPEGGEPDFGGALGG